MRIDQNFTADVIARARKRGATAVDVVAVEGDSASVQIRLSAVDKLSKAQEKRLGLRVYFGRRSAGGSTSDFSPPALDDLVETTCALAEAIVEDPDAGLPDRASLATRLPDLDLYDPTPMSMDQMIDRATRAEQAALASGPAAKEFRRGGIRVRDRPDRVCQQPWVLRGLSKLEFFMFGVSHCR